MKRKKDICEIDGVQHMKCTRCLEYFPYDSFPIRKDRWQPYRNCVVCMRIKARWWRKENQHKVKISDKNYRIIHRDEIKKRKVESAKLYYEKNKEEIKEKMRVYTKTKQHYMNRKRSWREWYDIGDNVMFNGHKFKIVGVRIWVWYLVQRYWSPVPITVPRKKLTPIKQISYE